MLHRNRGLCGLKQQNSLINDKRRNKGSEVAGSRIRFPRTYMSMCCIYVHVSSINNIIISEELGRAV